MFSLTYQQNTLHFANTSLETIAKKYGTPCYVYSASIIEQNVKAYTDMLSGIHGHVCYAVKANSNLAILHQLNTLGMHFDVVSSGELLRVLSIGVSANKIVFAGVGKSIAEIRLALEKGIGCFNVESQDELLRIDGIAQQMGVKAPIALRVNPNVDAKTHPYISTGLKENKFGVAIEDALALYQLANQLSGIAILGVACHIGSQLLDLSPYAQVVEKLLDLVDALKQHNIEIKHIDIGGGVGIAYHPNDKAPDLMQLGKILKNKCGDRKLTIAVEPGRSITATAGVFLTRVEYIKTQSDKKFVIVDGSMTELMRPALYQAYHHVLPLTQQSEAVIDKPCDIVGPVCESSDFLAQNRKIVCNQGDVLAVCSAGAYGFVMSSNYNTRPMCTEILIKKQGR